MKRNVDLTEDRLFTTPQPRQDPDLIFINIKPIKPWEFKFVEITSDFDFGIDIKSLIPLGSKTERELWKLSHNPPQICSVCGKYDYPWATKSCKCFSLSSSRRFPWKF